VQVSTILGAVIPSQRAERAWTEGVAIWVAVVVVSFVGAACALLCSTRMRGAVPLALLAGVSASACHPLVELVADALKVSAVHLPCTGT
jgi:hypothetical protein